MKLFLKLLFLKLLLSLSFLFLWLYPHKDIFSFFNPDTSNVYDSFRYGHDAYVLATGGIDFMGEVLNNPIIVIYAGLLYKYVFVHPIIVTLVNSLISISFSFFLYKSLRNYLMTDVSKLFFWASQFSPVIIAYEAILGKEIFYLTGFKCVIVSLVYLFFHKGKSRIWISAWYFLLALLFCFVRPILLIFFAIGIMARYLKTKYLLVASFVLGMAAFLIQGVNDIGYLKELNETVTSSNPIFQVLRSFLLSDSLSTNLIGGIARLFIYIVYPFPLILPEIWRFDLSKPFDWGSILLTCSEQFNFIYLGILLFIMSLSKNYYEVARSQQNPFRYLFRSIAGQMIFFAVSLPFISSRYRIFMFVLSFAFPVIQLRFKRKNAIS